MTRSEHPGGKPSAPVALQEWAQAARATLLPVALNRVGPNQAEDLVQQAIQEVWKRCTDATQRAWSLEKESLNALALRILQRRAADIFRRPRPTSAEHMEFQSPESDSNPADTADTMDWIRKLSDESVEFAALCDALREVIQKKQDLSRNWQFIGRAINAAMVKAGKAKPLKDDEALASLGKRAFHELAFLL